MKGNSYMLLLVAIIAVVTVLALFGAQQTGILDTKFSPSIKAGVESRDACLKKCSDERRSCIAAAEENIRATCYDEFPGCEEGYSPNGWCIPSDPNNPQSCDDAGCEACAVRYLQPCWDAEDTCRAKCPRETRGASIS